MQHLSHVRRDYRSKLEHAAARPNYRHAIDEVVAWYDAWQDGMDAFLPVAGKVQLTKVPSLLKGKFSGWNHARANRQNQEPAGIRSDNDGGGNGDVRGKDNATLAGSVSDGPHNRTPTGEVGEVRGPICPDGDPVSPGGQPDGAAGDCQGVPIEALPVVP